MKKQFTNFFIREWLFLFSFTAFGITSYMLGSFPEYTQKELIPIFLLFALFVVVKGIENSNLLLKTASILEKGVMLPQKLLFITFILSSIITIDVALITMLPIVFALQIKEKEKLTILVALTAHIGAALTPFGTPQNLFIYSYYGVDPFTFIKTIAPFSIGMLILFFFSSFFIKVRPIDIKYKEKKVNKPSASIYLILFTIIVLSILHIFSINIVFLALLFILFFDKKCFQIDYFLLFTFLIFIGLTTNIKMMIGTMIYHPHHTFLLSSIMSQFISNVPTTLLLNKFTTEWEALLWGSNVGSFGSIIAALANLITYKMYISYNNTKNVKSFLWQFIFFGYLAFLFGYLLYFISFSYFLKIF